MNEWLGALGQIIQRGGPVMWPLLGLSVLAVTLCLERAWFLTVTNNRRRVEAVNKVGRALRDGDHKTVESFAQRDGSVYGSAVRGLVGERGNEVAAVEVVETQRFRLERFMPVLATIISAAPMLGILGTVLGIIEAFTLLGGQDGRPDMSQVGAAIGEALITTATGIVVALLALFPYNWLKVQIDRTLARLDTLAASAAVGASGKPQGGESSTASEQTADQGVGSAE